MNVMGKRKWEREILRVESGVVVEKDIEWSRVVEIINEQESN